MDDLITARFAELAERSVNRSCFCYTDFLDLSGQAAFARVRNRLACADTVLFGGHEGCERKMLRFGSPEELGYDPGFPIRCLQAVPADTRFSSGLTHRDYLGALMALGVTRDVIGDIVVRDGAAWIFCEDHIADYLCDHLLQAGRTTLTVRRAETPPEGELFRLQEKQIQLASNRLDAFLASVWNISRSEAQELIRQEKVFCNAAACISSSRSLAAGDIVSARGFGRFRFERENGQSRKGKLNLIISLYV